MYCVSTCVCVCVCVCVCARARARIFCVVLESNSHGNEKFCTRPARTTSCNYGNDIFTRLQIAGRGVNHPRLPKGEIKERADL